MRLDKINPVHCIDGNVVLTEYGDVSFCYRIELDEINTIDIMKYNGMHSAFLQMLYVLPENVLIQRQEVFTNSIYDSSLLFSENKSSDYFEDSLINHYGGRIYKKQQSFFYITFLDSLSFKRDININRYFKKISNTESYIKKIKDYEQFANKAIATLSSDFKIHALTESELKHAIENHFNGYEENKVTTPFFKPEFKIGKKYFSVFGLDEDKNQKDGDISLCIPKKEMSTEISKLYNSYIADLGYSLDAEHIINTYIFYDNQEAIKKELETNQSKLKGVKGLKNANDVASERIDNFLNLVEIDNARIVRCSMNITLFNEDVQLLSKQEKNLQTILGKLGIVPSEYSYLDYPYIFLANAPGCGGHLPNEYTFLTIDQIAFIYFLYEGNKIDFKNDVGLIYSNRLSNIPYKLDTFFKPYESKLIDNRNFIRIAPSGGGKSFDQRATTYEQYRMDFDQIMINIGGDDKVCRLINNYSQKHKNPPTDDAIYIKYEQGKTLDINPFYVENSISNDKIEFLITFIWLLWGGKNEISSDIESVLGKIIVMYYSIDTSKTDEVGNFIIDTVDKELSINSFYGFIEENITEINSVFGNDISLFSINSLKLNLEKFARGNYSNLFTREKPSLFEKKKYVEFELDNIKDHPFLFTIFTMLISDITFNTMWKTDGNHKEFMIDEGWKILQKKDSGMAVLLIYLYKTIRKFDGAVGIAIQQITDLSHDAIVENAILGNCSIKHIYNHKNVVSQIPILKDKLSLTESDIAQLLSIRNKQQLLFVGDNSRYSEKLLVLGSEFARVVRIETSPELAVIYDSEKSRLKIFDNFYEFSDQDLEKTVTLYLNN